MASLYLRRATAPERALGPLTPDDVLQAAPSGEDCVSLRVDDAFVPLDRALDRDGSLRDVLLQAFPTAHAVRYARARFLLFVGLVPLAALALLDLELLRGGRVGAVQSLAVDVLFAATTAFDLARPTPREPRVSAAALFATAARFVLLALARCALGPQPLLLILAAIAAASATTLLALAPSPRAVADHLRRALAIARPTRLPSTSTPGFYRYIAFATAAAALLPCMLSWLQSSDISVPLQLLAFVAFAVFVPYVGRVYVGKDMPPHRDALAAAIGAHSRWLPRNPRGATQATWRVLRAAVVALVLSLALVRGAQHTIEAAGEAQACVTGARDQRTSIQRFVAAQRLDVNASRSRPEPWMLLLTVVVVPIAEELVYRGLVQHALRRRIHRHAALALAALLFGFAHFAVARTAVYQPVLLGLSFGRAYEASGILASVLAHMLWNLWLSL